MKLLFKIILLVAIASLNGCVTHGELLNYQDIPIVDQNGNIAPRVDSLLAPIAKLYIGPNDVLDIKVFSIDIETAAPFNIIPSTDQRNNNNTEAIQLNGYLVDRNGTIDFPVLGTIQLMGLTIAEAKRKIKAMLQEYLKSPVVNIRILNFAITVSGEVRNQGVYTILNERVTLPDALALAGGLTDYANRNNILIVRENNGVRTLNRINMSTSNFFFSQFYYLKQNDMIYVEPIRAKAGAVRDQTSKSLPIIGAGATLVALAISIFR